MACKHDRNVPGAQEMAYLAAGAELAFPSCWLLRPCPPRGQGQLPASLTGAWFWSFSSGDVQSHHKAQTTCPGKMVQGSRGLENISKFWHQTAMWGQAGPLSMSLAHPADHDKLLLLFQGSLERGKDQGRTTTSWGSRACRARHLTAFGLTGHFQPSLKEDRDLRGAALSQFVWAKSWGEGLVPGSHAGKDCA